jgi:hypothetical protein
MSQAVVNPARKRRGRLTVCGMLGFAVTVGLASRRFNRSRENGCFRRNLAVAARSGEGPFTIRFADLHDRAMQTSGLLSWRSKPEGKLDGGESNEGAQGFGKVLEVLGETPVASKSC